MKSSASPWAKNIGIESDFIAVIGDIPLYLDPVIHLKKKLDIGLNSHAGKTLCFDRISSINTSRFLKAQSLKTKSTLGSSFASRRTVAPPIDSPYVPKCISCPKRSNVSLITSFKSSFSR